MKKILILMIITLGLLIAGCGDPSVDINEPEFETKIVVEGYLYPGEPVSRIKLMKNFELNLNIDPYDILLIPNRDNVKADINGHELSFDYESGTYFTDEFIPEYSTEYTLSVEAEIDGKTIYTKSTTLTPQIGFGVVEEDLGTIVYREVDPTFSFTTSPATGFYTFSIKPLDASLDNFIYDNPYLPNLSREDVEDNYEDYVYQLDVILNLNGNADELINYKVKGLDTWFYSNYQVIVYAGDENFKDYVITADNVQEPDGNFVEPRFHFEGDGIGVFGSAIRDTVKFNLVK